MEFTFSRDKAIKVGVHNGIFHTDDVLCVVMIKYLYNKNMLDSYQVVRTRDEKRLSECDIVCDIGCKDIITDNRLCFDHHQADSESYPNGVKMAACGKLFRYLNNRNYFGLDETGTEYMLEHLFYPIEAQDNGQQNIEEVRCPNQLSFVSAFNANWDEDQGIQDSRFNEAVFIGYEIFIKLLQRARSTQKITIEMSQEIDKYSSNPDGVLILSKFIPWNEAVLKYNNALHELDRKMGSIRKIGNEDKGNNIISAVVFPAIGEGYNCQMVPVDKGTYDTYKTLPWKGLRGDELSNASDIEGGIFCHPAGFISGWKTLESAHKAGLSAINN